MFQMHTNGTKRKEKNKVLQDKYHVAKWSYKDLKALHKSLIQLLKVAVVLKL